MFIKVEFNSILRLFSTFLSDSLKNMKNLVKMKEGKIKTFTSKRRKLSFDTDFI